KEQAFKELLQLAEYKALLKEYEKATTDDERMESVRKRTSELLGIAGIEIPGFREAKNAPGAAQALLAWLEEKEGLLLNPMTLPLQIQIYKPEPPTTRALPVLLAEFGTVYRFEQTGELSGLTRVRGFTQDNAHLCCTDEQVGQEFAGCIEFTRFFLDTLGL